MAVHHKRSWPVCFPKCDKVLFNFIWTQNLTKLTKLFLWWPHQTLTIVAPHHNMFFTCQQWSYLTMTALENTNQWSHPANRDIRSENTCTSRSRGHLVVQFRGRVALVSAHFHVWNTRRCSESTEQAMKGSNWQLFVTFDSSFNYFLNSLTIKREKLVSTELILLI